MKPLTLEKIQILISRLVGKEASDLGDYFYPAQPRHISDIVEMRQRILPDIPPEDDSTYIQWRYSFAPYESIDNALNETRMWVFEIDNEILSVVGVHAINLQCDGNEFNSIATMDLLSPLEHEGKGLGAWINLKLQSFGRPVLAMGSNKNSVSMVNKFYAPMPHRKIYRKILASPSYFSKKIKNQFLGKIVSSAYQIYLKIILTFEPTGWDKRYELKKINQFDNSHNKLLERLRMEKIYVKRSITALNWRLFEFPKEDALVYGIYSNQEILGYIALLIAETKTAKTATIIDWGYLKDTISQKDFAIALSKIQLSLLNDRVGDLSAYAYDRNSAEIFKRAGIHYRDDTSKTLSIHLPEDAKFQQLQEYGAWFLTGFDADDV